MSKRCNVTLRQAIFAHDNDYGFDVDDVLTAVVSNLPTLSVVIPHYDSDLLVHVIDALYVGLERAQADHPQWQYEVIVVDDGSHVSASTRLGLRSYKHLTHVVLATNTGRTNARNAGLKRASNDIMLFLDADVVISPTIIADHLRVHARASASRHYVTVGFFTTVSCTDDEMLLGTGGLLQSPRHVNDFRLSCVYQSSWIGCADDARFVGRRFEIVRETSDFRAWPTSGYFGPWILPNMVLGGFFMTDRRASLAVGGFDPSFEGYGFTETSLPTKLIALCDHYVVPVVGDGCLHVDCSRGDQSRTEKDNLFRLRHQYYFTHYLEKRCGEVVNEL